MKRCLDFDYHHSKLPKLYSISFYSTLEKYYRIFKTTYLILRSLCIDPHGDVTSIMFI